MPSRQSRSVGQPAAGFYLHRKVRRAPLVPARIVYAPTRDPSDRANRMDRSWYWTLFINGEIEAGPSLTIPDAVWSVYHSADFISGRDYALRVKQARWDRKWNPNAPKPDEPIDLETAPTVF